MSHLFESGFTVRKAAWHGLGTILDEAPKDWSTARKIAGLTWEPQVVPSYYRKLAQNVTADDVVLAQVTINGITEFVVEDVTGRKVLRDDSQKVLGSGVGAGWTPVTNETLGEVADALVDSGGVFWTAGSLDEGRKVYTTILLDEPYVIGSDQTMVKYPFLAVTNAHDGSGSFFAQPSTFEVVCANTAKAAEMVGERIGRQFKFSHTGKVMDRINEAKAAIAGLRDDAAAVRQIEQELFDMPINEAQVRLFANLFAPTAPPDDLGASSRVRTNANKARDSWFKLLHESPTIAEDQRFTALGLVRASTEFLDHVRGYRSESSYAYRSLLKVEPLKYQAVRLAREVAAN